MTPPRNTARGEVCAAARDLVDYLDGGGIANVDEAVEALGRRIDDWRGPARIVEMVTPDQLARSFHAHYERMAPAFGYKTRPATAVAFDDLPDDNRALMGAVAAAVLLEHFPDRVAIPFAPPGSTVVSADPVVSAD